MSGTGNGTSTGKGTDRTDRTDRSTHAVIVVGAGPTGLLLAGDLAEAGVPVTLLEKRPTRSATSPGRSACTPARWSSSMPVASPTTCSPPAAPSPGCGCSAASPWTSPHCPPASRSC